MELSQFSKQDFSRAQYFSEDLIPRRFNPIELIKAASEGVGQEFEWDLEKMLEHLDRSEQIFEIHSESELLTGLIYFRALPGGLEIDYVYSSPQFRRQGVIKRLIQKLFSRMKSARRLYSNAPFGWKNGDAGAEG